MIELTFPWHLNIFFCAAIFWLLQVESGREILPSLLWPVLKWLNSSGHYMYNQFNIQQFYVLPTHTVFMCFVWISEQTAIISLYNINWLVCVTETECVYCAVRTEHLTFSSSTFCPHSVFVCFVWVWEQTAIISLYNINWLVCITETECVCRAVRTESLYTILRSTHTVYLCVLCGSEKQRLFPYTTLNDWFV